LVQRNEIDRADNRQHSGRGGSRSDCEPAVISAVCAFRTKRFQRVFILVRCGALRIDKRFSHGLSFLLSYTCSKNLDYVDNLSNGVNGQPTSNPTRFNSKLNKGPAGFDIRHVLVLSNIWEIPGRTNHRLLDAVIAGWQLSNVFTYHSGLPLSVYLGSDNENIGSVGGRFPEYPDLVGDPNAIANPTPSQWFNTKAFAIPKLYTVGTAGRNILRSDNLISDDFSLSKNWKFRERVAFELRGEIFQFVQPYQLRISRSDGRDHAIWSYFEYVESGPPSSARGEDSFLILYK
jgi:hypothetical protein